MILLGMVMIHNHNNFIVYKGLIYAYEYEIVSNPFWNHLKNLL